MGHVSKGTPSRLRAPRLHSAAAGAIALCVAGSDQPLGAQQPVRRANRTIDAMVTADDAQTKKHLGDSFRII